MLIVLIKPHAAYHVTFERGSDSFSGLLDAILQFPELFWGSSGCGAPKKLRLDKIDNLLTQLQLSPRRIPLARNVSLSRLRLQP